MAKIYYYRTDEFWRKEQKYDFLEQQAHRGQMAWQAVAPDRKHTWLTEGFQTRFDDFLPIGKQRIKPDEGRNIPAIFRLFSNGNDSGRDRWVYNFDHEALIKNARMFSETYNSEVDRWFRIGQPKNVDGFVSTDNKRIKWTRNAKRDLRQGRQVTFSLDQIRVAIYRPFMKQYHYPGRIYNKEIAQFSLIFPIMVLMSSNIVDLHLVGAGCGTQCFPFYTYGEDGSNRRENITDWALAQFRARYQTAEVSKTSAVSSRELPRIPLVKDFWGFAQAGARLAELHANYEQQPEFPLKFIENPDEPLNWRVEKMRLSKDKSQIKYNDFLTLAGIPPEVYDYKLGNRSALDWVIDQYQVSTDPRSGIVNDPNNLEDEQYIVRLIGQVITVSLETVEIVKNLPPLDIEE